jgi:hypothetical protein
MTKRAQQFECLAAGVMDSGSPIATGYVRFYAAGTTTLKNAYADKDKGSSFTKLALDADSRGVAYGDGIYKLKFYAGDPDDGGTDTGITIDNYKCTAVMGAIRTITSDDDIDRDDELVLADTTSDDITVTLDDVGTIDNPITIKKIAAANTVTIATTDSQLIDGSSTVTMTVNNQTVTLYPDQSADAWRKGSDAGQAIAGDTTANRTLRSSRLTITDGTDASTAQCTLASKWNGDSASAVDNIPGDDTLTSGYSIDESAAAAPDVEIHSTLLSGNCVAVLAATISENATGSDLLVYGVASGNNIKLFLTNPPSGGSFDITTLVDTGDIKIDILYLTDA